MNKPKLNRGIEICLAYYIPESERNDKRADQLFKLFQEQFIDAFPQSQVRNTHVSKWLKKVAV